MRSQLAASFPCTIYAWNLQFAQRWQLCKWALKVSINSQSWTMSIKADQTKLLFKILMPWTSFVKAVTIYWKLKLKEQCVKSVPLEIMPCACCSNYNVELMTLKFSWMETFYSVEVELTLMGLWNWAVEGQLHVVQEKKHQQSLVIRIEKSCEGWRHWTCEQIVC